MENVKESQSISSIIAGKSDSEIEDLLDRMLTRLALCDDSKLQDLLHKLLPLSISALSSPSQSVRNKVSVSNFLIPAELLLLLLLWILSILLIQLNRRITEVDFFFPF